MKNNFVMPAKAGIQLIDLRFARWMPNPVWHDKE